MVVRGHFLPSRCAVLVCVSSLLFSLVPMAEVRGASPGRAWVERYDGPPNGMDHAWAVAMDDQGNVAVTGDSTGAGAGSDLTTIKYDAEGNELWVARYDWDLYDGAQHIAMDGDGNVYVAGSIGVYHRDQWVYYLYDYVTIKYDPDGNQLWVARYDGPGNRDDTVRGLEVDGEGNVYVTGTSGDEDYSDDYATIKYDPDGNTVWVARHDHPESESAYATAIALDAAGNVYVTGSAGTVKLDASGNELWCAPYGGSTPYDVAVDDAGNAVVTGRARAVSPDPYYDYLTSRYDPEGNELWTARYDGPAHDWDWPARVVLDASSNAYVTGRSVGIDTLGDLATVKYDPDGNELWVARHDGPDHGEDGAQDLALDAAGNLLVVGYVATCGNEDFATVKYDPDGNPLWVSTYNGPRQGVDRAEAVAVNALERVAVVGVSRTRITRGEDEERFPYMPEGDYATVVFDSAGDRIWEVGYSGEGPGSDRAEAILLVDGEGLYVTGSSGTIKYSQTGSRLWVADDGGTAVAGDPGGNLLLAGTDKGTVKLDPDGGLVWASQDSGTSVAVDAQGDIFVTGSAYRAGSGIDFHTLKYDSAGNTLWEAFYDGPLGGPDVAAIVALDATGNVVVAGNSSFESAYNDVVLIKYDSQGNELWVEQPGCIEFADLAVDQWNNVIVTCGNYNYVTVKYDPDGNELWIAEYEGPGDGYGHSSDWPAALTVDSVGNVYVTGESKSFLTPGFAPLTQCALFVGEPAPRRTSGATCSPEFHASGATSTSDYATVKYDPDGNELWVARYEGLLDLYFWDERATDVALDNAGNVYVTGNRSAYYMVMNDVVTIKYSPFGTELWKVAYDGRARCIDEATSIAVDGAGAVYVAGGSIGRGTREDYFTIKYSESSPSLWTAPASAEAAGHGSEVVSVSNRIGLLCAFVVPLLIVVLLRRRSHF